MDKYILSKKCRIVDVNTIKVKDSIFHKDILKLEEKGAFLLEKNKKHFTINQTIKIFLEYFYQPISLDTTIDKISSTVQCKREVIENQITVFFNQMVKNEFLIPEDDYKKQLLTSDSDNPSVEAGTIIKGYKFIERIFTNSKIEIYKVTNIKNNNKYAAKILKKSKLNNRMLKIFFQEFELMQIMGSHDHICKAIEIIETSDIIFGLSEFIDGLSARKYITKGEPSPSLLNRLNLLTQFFDAMAFIHKQSITHGDLHLSNVLIDKNNILKIIDFNMSNRSVPLENEVVHEGGVYQYISPEKVNSGLFKIVNGPASFASEVYQMGIISYFFLYETMPFNGFTWVDLVYEIKNKKPIFLTHTPNGELIPIAVIRFVKRMMSKTPENRFDNAVKVFKSWKTKQCDTIACEDYHLDLQTTS